MMRYLIALRAIVMREALRFIHQRERFIAALVRPLVWLLVFAAGFRAALGLSIIPPYQTYITYETYIVPGLCGMVLLFNGMQSSLSLVYDRETGSMRLLLTAPLPPWLVAFLQIAGHHRDQSGAGLYLPADRLFLRDRDGAFGLYRCDPCPDPVWSDVGLTRLGAVILHQTAGKLCGCHELCHLPDVLSVQRALPALENGRKLAPVAGHLRGEPVHPCGRTDPLCALSGMEPVGAVVDCLGRRCVHGLGALGL